MLEVYLRDLFGNDEVHARTKDTDIARRSPGSSNSVQGTCFCDGSDGRWGSKVKGLQQDGVVKLWD